MIVHTVYPNCSDSIFVSHDALCLTEYLHYLHKDVVKQHDIVAIALDYYLQYYYWIICSGLLCIITGLLYLLRGRGFIPCYCLHSPPVSIQRDVQSSSILSSTFLLDLHFKTTQPCFCKDIWRVFYKQMSDVFTLNKAWESGKIQSEWSDFNQISRNVIWTGHNLSWNRFVKNGI